MSTHEETWNAEFIGIVYEYFYPYVHLSNNFNKARRVSERKENVLFGKFVRMREEGKIYWEQKTALFDKLLNKNGQPKFSLPAIYLCWAIFLSISVFCRVVEFLICWCISFYCSITGAVAQKPGTTITVKIYSSSNAKERII